PYKRVLSFKIPNVYILFQKDNSKHVWVIEFWNLELICDLVLGIWDLGRHRAWSIGKYSWQIAAGSKNQELGSVGGRGDTETRRLRIECGIEHGASGKEVRDFVLRHLTSHL
ncbi:MAG: hypothetical protein PVF44_05875, partial [Syntrophobacterales bacterium]